jgi:hypothetical protein
LPSSGGVIKELQILIAFKYTTVLISGFRRDVDEICALLGYYTASCDNTWFYSRNIYTTHNVEIQTHRIMKLTINNNNNNNNTYISSTDYR